MPQNDSVRFPNIYKCLALYSAKFNLAPPSYTHPKEKRKKLSRETLLKRHSSNVTGTTNTSSRAESIWVLNNNRYISLWWRRLTAASDQYTAYSSCDAVSGHCKADGWGDAVSILTWPSPLIMLVSNSSEHTFYSWTIPYYLLCCVKFRSCFTASWKKITLPKCFHIRIF